MNEYDVKRLLKSRGLPVPDGILIGSDLRIPEHNLRYPLVAKVSSSKIVSKSDLGGVQLGIRNDEELKKSVSEVIKIEGAEGILIEEMALPGLEVIAGGVIDPQFGPVVMFGLGGIFTEVFKDTAFGLAPLDRDNALWLIRQIKGYRLLEGYRGRPPIDREALVKIIITVSEMMAEGGIEEIDLNPIALYPDGALILDAKMSVRAWV